MEKVIFCLLSISAILSIANGIRYTVSAPNYFRLDISETVSVTISEHNVPVEVELYLKENKASGKVLHLKRITIQDGKPNIVELKYSSGDLPQNLNKKDPISVYLGIKATKGEFVGKEVLVPVRKHAGFAFVQTDKPLYTPKENVRIRVLYLDEDLLPNDKSFQLSIMDPKGQLIFNKEFKPEQKGITEYTYQFSSIPLLGNWSVTASYGYDFSGKSTVRFDVKEYVLPTFSVSIEPPEVILNSHTTIDTVVKADYVYGKPVVGIVTVKYSIVAPNGQIVEIGSTQLQKLVYGKRYFSMDIQRLIKNRNIPWFPAVRGSRLLIEATVIEKSTGKREKASDNSTVLTSSPYKISFPRSVKDFKPGVPYQVQVDLKRSNDQTAAKIPMRVLKAVTKVNGADARVLPVPLRMLTDDLGTVMFEFDTVETDVQLEITVTTDDPKLARENQATGVLTVNKFRSSDGNSYVWIAAPQDVIFKVGKSFQTKVTVYPAQGNIKLHYMVVSRGKIITVNETATQQGAVVRNIQFVVTPEMSPISRLVVYIVKNNVIIADSIRFEVEKKCKYNNEQELKLETKSHQVSPGNQIEINVHGEPGSTVGLLAVDKAVYLLNKEDLLTRQAMFVEMSKHDLGCGPGGGINTEAVFQNAGLLLISSAGINAHGRQGDCNVNDRRKRSVKTDIGSSPKLEDKYTGQAASCCKLGKLDGPPGLECSERADKISAQIKMDINNCTQAFLDCCESQKINMSLINPLFRQGGADDRRNDLDDFQLLERFEKETLKNIRYNFPETWFYSVYTVGSRECKGQRKDICELQLSVPHSITTWLIQGVGISRKTGMCVAESIDLRVFKPIFIQMQLPYSAVKGEQIVVPVTVFNYGPTDITVNVYMYGLEGVCMGASPGEKSEVQKIRVKSNNAATVTFPVMPLEVGSYPLRAIALSVDGTDSVEKPLNVVPEGVPETKSKSFTLDPRGIMKNRKKRDLEENGIREKFDVGNNQQTVIVDLTLPKEHIPGTGKCVVSAIGELVSQAVTTTIQGLEARFFYLPRGCCEQTMGGLAPLVYAMLFLKKTNKLTPQSETNGRNLIAGGCSHLIKYKNDDGSYSSYMQTAPNTWLTAYIGKVLCQASAFTAIPENAHCSAVNWLLQRQQANGNFDIYGLPLNGGQHTTAQINAFILITLSECSQCYFANKKSATDKVISNLENSIRILSNPYDLAIVTYGLALARSSRASYANEKLKALAITDEDRSVRFWNWGNANQYDRKRPWTYTGRAPAIAIETTSYALLAQLALNDPMYSAPIANWLNQQRNSAGTFSSTMDSIVALQALAQFPLTFVMPPLNLHCNFTSQVRRTKKSISMNTDNLLMTHEFEVPIGGDLHVDVTGQGVGTVTVALKYNVESKKKDKCQFKLSIKPKELKNVHIPEVVFKGFEDLNLTENVIRSVTSKKDQKMFFNYKVDGVDDDDDADDDEDDDNDDDYVDYKVVEQNDQQRHIVALDICTRHLAERPSGMSILEVGMFTGYRPWVDDVLAIVNNKAHLISEFEYSDQSVIFYFDQIPNDKDICIQLRTFQKIKVGKVQPAMVKVYDYYEPDNSCTKFYQPDGQSPMLSSICEGTQCRCVEGQCPKPSPFDRLKRINEDTKRRNELLAMACNEHHFVWSGTLLRFEQEDSFNHFVFKVNEVLKEGIQRKEDVKGTQVTFVGRSACEYPRMQQGKNYIVMGSDGFRYQNEDGVTGFKYMFDKKTSVYETRPLKELRNVDDQNLQKTFDWLYKRMAMKGVACDN